MKRKIMGLGRYSAVVAIPKELLRMLGWRRGQHVEVGARGKTLMVRDFKTRRKT